MTVFLLSAAIMALPLLAERYIPTGDPVRGIRCERMEGTALHTHQHLAIFDRGKPVPIPEDIGRPLFAGCFYWIHTHTPDGIIHVESPVPRTFTLGDFFAIWGEPLTRTQVAEVKVRKGDTITVWVNGSRYTGNPASIPLYQHSDITIDVGKPATKPAPFVDWNGN